MSDFEHLSKKISDLEERVSKIESILNEKPDKPHPSTKEGSIKEFILSKKPADDVKKTLAIGYFLEKYKGLTSFNVEDIGRSFRLAKESVPKNVNDKINMNIKKGHMMEAEEKKENKKAWVLTNKGEQFVENNFSENGKGK